MFSRVILGNVDTCRTECEISDDVGNTVVVVYDSKDGWHVNVLREPTTEQVAEFNATVGAAKQSLSKYVNRMGRNPPEGMTAGGLSLWLMQKDDGTALGIVLAKRKSSPGSALPNISPDLKERMSRSLVMDNRTILDGSYRTQLRSRNYRRRQIFQRLSETHMPCIPVNRVPLLLIGLKLLIADRHNTELLQAMPILINSYPPL